MTPATRHPVALVAALLAVLASSAGGLSSAAAAQQENEHLISSLRTIKPPADGLQLEVQDRGRFLELRNGTGKTVIVKGYDNEPYLRFGPGPEVDVNARSPSKFVNEDRFGRTPVPAAADSSAPPRWQPVASDGRYRWFEHRIHYMGQGTPPEVKDPAKPAKVFDWSVPMTVQGQPTRAFGTLAWDPDPSTASSSSSGLSGPAIAAIAAGGVALLAALAWLLRRRRGRSAAAGSAGRSGDEAW